MQRAVQVPSALAIALQGLVVLFVVSSDLYVRRRTRRRVGEDGPEEAVEGAQFEEPPAGTGEGANVASADVASEGAGREEDK